MHAENTEVNSEVLERLPKWQQILYKLIEEAEQRTTRARGANGVVSVFKEVTPQNALKTDFTFVSLHPPKEAKEVDK